MKTIPICLFIILLSLSVFCYGEQYSLKQYLNIKANFSPHFVPNSNDILYGNSRTGVFQVWRASINGGEPTQITDFEEGVDYFYVHPYEDILLLGVDKGGNERTQLYIADCWGDDLKRITDDDSAIFAFGGFSRDGRYLVYESNKRDPKFFDIYLYDIDFDITKVIHESDNSNFSTGFSPDGRYVNFVRAYDSNNDDLFLIDLENDNELLHITPHEGDARYGGPEWLPDGSGFYFSSNQGREFTNLAYYNMKKRDWRWIETPDWDLEGYGVSVDGRYLWWEVNEEGYDELHTKDLKTGELIYSPEMTPGQFNGITFSSDSEYMLFGHNSPDNPNDIYRWKVDSYEEPKRITRADLAGIPENSFVVPKLVHYNSFDGLEIPCFVYKPKDLRVGERVPVVVSIHGGPESQAQAWFDGMAQYFLNRDFAYVVPNIRGSSGYGDTYAHLDDRFNRLDSIKDVEYLNRWLRRKSWVDNSKLIIEGASYGGYVVLACLTEQPQLWSAGVDSVGISNFVTFLENTGPWRRHLRESEYGYLATDREFLEKISPVNSADEIIAPLVVIQGANDPRVPQEEAEQIVSVARENGVPVLYLLYENEGHGLTRLENRLDAYPKVIAFLEMALEGDVEIFTEKFREEYLKSWSDSSKDVELIDSEFESIQEYINDKEYEKAELKLEEILKLDENSFSANELMRSLRVEKYTYEGISLYESGELKKSLSAFEKVAQLEPDNEMIKDYIETINETIRIREEERTRQEQIESLISTAETYSARKQYEIAIKQYTRVMELDPGNTEIKKRISSLRDKLRVKEKEIEEVEITEDVESIYEEGVGLINSGRYSDGIRVLEYVYNSYGGYRSTVSKLTTAYFYLGMSSYGEGFYEDAVGYWSRILEIDPTNSEVRKMVERARLELEGLR